MKTINIDDQNWAQAPGYLKNLLLAADDLRCEGARVQIVSMKPKATIDNHYHATSHEFYYVLQGECRVIINGEVHFLKRGNMLLIEPGDVHRLVNDGEEEFRLLVFKTNSTLDDTHWTDRESFVG